MREQIDRRERPWTDIAEFFTAEAVFIDPVWGRIEGKQAIRELYAEAMAGVDFTFPIDFTAINGNFVIIKWRQVLPGARADGTPWQQSAVSTLIYAGDGKFRYEEDLMNVIHVMEDIQSSGWVPGPNFVSPPPNPDRNFDPQPAVPSQRK